MWSICRVLYDDHISRLPSIVFWPSKLKAHCRYQRPLLPPASVTAPPIGVMMTSRHGNTFSINDSLWVEYTGDRSRRPVMRWFDVFFLVSLNKLLKTPRSGPRRRRHDAYVMSLRWHHNEPDGVSTHRRLNCLLNRLFMHRLKKTSKLCATGLYEGNSPVTGEFPT